MWRDDGYLVEMLLRARDAREMAAGISLVRLKAEIMPQYALAMALEQRGEAARKVSTKGRENALPPLQPGAELIDELIVDARLAAEYRDWWGRHDQPLIGEDQAPAGVTRPDQQAKAGAST